MRSQTGSSGSHPKNVAYSPRIPPTFILPQASFLCFPPPISGEISEIPTIFMINISNINKGLAAAHLLQSGSRLSYPFGVAIVATLWPWQRLGLTSRTRGVPAYRSNSLEFSHPIAADPISRSHVQISCVNTAHWFSSYVFKLASLQFGFLLIQLFLWGMNSVDGAEKSPNSRAMALSSKLPILYYIVLSWKVKGDW